MRPGVSTTGTLKRSRARVSVEHLRVSLIAYLCRLITGA